MALRWSAPSGDRRGSVVLLHVMSLGATWWQIGPALAAFESDGELVRSDRDRLLRRAATEHPDWAPADVENDVEGIARAQIAAVAAGLRGGLRDWDLPGLLAAAPVRSCCWRRPTRAGRSATDPAVR